VRGAVLDASLGNALQGGDRPGSAQMQACGPRVEPASRMGEAQLTKNGNCGAQRSSEIARCSTALIVNPLRKSSAP
jgi:hypothetical protein